jgi:sporulation protein YlmC with PRC-barrel domain
MTLTTRPSGRIIGGHKEGDIVTEIIGSSALLEHPIINAVGESLGQIREVLVDIGAGRVAYAIVELTGSVSANDKFYVVPWAALTLDAANRCFILNVDKRRLKDAPCFGREQWPHLTTTEWSKAVDSFYSAEPFWRYQA